MAKSLLDKLIDSIFDEKFTGWNGERLTERELKLVKLFGRKGIVVRNVYIPKDNGETSEIDVLFITQKGIFVMESKNYSGWIFGDEASAYWTASLPNGQKNRFYNPVRQNNSHMKWLSHFIGEDVPLFSLIVFSERCELKKITIFSEQVSVIKRDRLYYTIKTIWDSAPDVLDEDRVNQLAEILKERRNVDTATKEAHIDNIQQRYKKQLEPSEIPVPPSTGSAVQNEMQSEMRCPQCGSALVLRMAKRGKNAGRQFYGCSAYPKCRFIKNLDES